MALMLVVSALVVEFLASLFSMLLSVMLLCVCR